MSRTTSGPSRRSHGVADGRAVAGLVDGSTIGPSPDPRRGPASQCRQRLTPPLPPRPARARRARRWRSAWRWNSATRSLASCPVQSPGSITVSPAWFSWHGHVPDGRERTAPEHHAKVEHQVEDSGAGGGRGGMPMKGRGAVDRDAPTIGCRKGPSPDGRRVMAWLSHRHRLQSWPPPVRGMSCWPPSSASRDHARTGLPAPTCASGSTRGWAGR